MKYRAFDMDFELPETIYEVNLVTLEYGDPEDGPGKLPMAWSRVVGSAMEALDLCKGHTVVELEIAPRATGAWIESVEEMVGWGYPRATVVGWLRELEQY